VIVTRADHESALAGVRASAVDPRAGILGPRSVAWRVGGDLGLFLGGGRAALLQLAHPMVAYAIHDHSRTRADVVGRFQRTFRHVFAMLYGELDEALAAARRVHAIHTRIHGTLPIAIGGYAAGTPYHANDVAALRWVHATLVDTALLVRERLDGPLPLTVKDRYVVELNRFASLFGIPTAQQSNTFDDHASYMSDMFSGDRLAVAPCALEMAHFLIGRAGAPKQPVLGRITEAITHALLPPHLATQYQLRAAPLRTRAGLSAFAALYRQLPRALVALPAATAARRRLANKAPSPLAAWAERRLFGLAHRTTGT
jgi:uncharacterized protein (DUF2236 family)